MTANKKPRTVLSYKSILRRDEILVRVFLKHMIFKILSGFVAASLLAGSAFGQPLKMKRNGNLARVMQGKKILYQVALRGRKNEKRRRYDEAFLAGGCLIVRRDIRQRAEAGEVYPEVSRLEIYRTNGKRRIYYESKLAISRIDDWDLINSPDLTWAIVPDSGEGEFSGYFHISEDCRVSEVSFSENGFFDWGDKQDGVFVDAATLKFPALLNRPVSGPKKKMDIFIMKDGKYRFEIVDK